MKILYIIYFVAVSATDMAAASSSDEVVVIDYGTFMSYHVGNSLTNDARVVEGSGLPRIIRDAGLNFESGWHIDCGDGLYAMTLRPDEECVPPPAKGKWYEALPNYQWDAITLQPFGSDGSTLTTEYQAAKQMILSTAYREQTSFFIYETWPNLQPGKTIEERWFEPVSVDPNDLFLRNNAHLEWVYNQLVNDPDLSGLDIRVVPAVDALIAVEKRILAGDLQGLSDTADLYRDSIHLNNLGRYVAANTMIATLLREATTNWPFNDDFLRPTLGLVPLPTESQRIIQEEVWGVVSNHPYTGVIAGDINWDGFVGIDDLNEVLNAWGQTRVPGDWVDRNGDSTIGIEDLNEVLINWNAVSTLSSTPEASSLMSLVTFASLYCLRRR